MALDISSTLSSKKKKIRVSKNRKKNWNKVCNINDVEEYLEEKRFEERIGGPPSQKSDAELFFLHTTRNEKENKKVKKPLKCFQNIGAFSKVSPPVDPDRIRFTKKIKDALLKRQKKKLTKILHTLSNENKPLKKDKTGTLFDANFHDLWGTDKSKDIEIQELIDYRDEITNKKTPKVPKLRYLKPSLLSAVEVPHPGASYNPTFEDHQNLLMEAVKIKQKKKKDEFHLKRVLTRMFPTKNEAPTEESILKEMSQGLFDEEKQDEQPFDEDCTLTKNPPVSFQDRVSKSRKKKRKLLKELERQKKLEKIQKKRENDVFRLKSIKAELKKKAAITEERKKKREKQKIEKLYKPRTLSKYKYEPPKLEVNLTKELNGSLRDIKMKGNLLEDRFKSLQRRNLIEPRIKQKRKRKYKLKVQIKRSHRNIS